MHYVTLSQNFFNFCNICVNVADFRLQNILQYTTKDRDTYTYTVFQKLKKNLGECSSNFFLLPVEEFASECFFQVRNHNNICDFFILYALFFARLYGMGGKGSPMLPPNNIFEKDFECPVCYDIMAPPSRY
jgi:hypothetical protein